MKNINLFVLPVLVISSIILLLLNINHKRVQYLVITSNNDKYLNSKESRFIQRPFSKIEKSKFLDMCNKLNGTLYKTGGNSIEEGLDCSGLLVFLYNQLGCTWFRNENILVNDISSESFYRFNCEYISNPGELISGDLIFFDTDSNNVIEHISIFSKLDEANNVWVWDASDYPDGEIINKVSYRKINNFWAKNPKLGKPLKTMEVGSYWDFLIFP